jgi:group II intron reverse transcriptase/maturase
MFPTAAEKTRKGTDGEADGSVLPTATCAGAKVGNKRREALPALVMEVIADIENLKEAFKRVAANKGAPGPDGKDIEEVRKHLPQLLPQLAKSLLTEEYRPGDIRRVWIPKTGGKPRGLGIPDVIDRLVAQAVLQVMQPHYDPDFDQSSHGFRPGRSCHTAIAEAKSYVEAGYEWVVDIDLEKFFDTVNHQRLLNTLEQKITDRRIIRLINKMLKARVVMPDGVVVMNEQGTPQGGPLSPLLSNIVLNELDAKLRERGHKFVRYADDCNIYVRSEKAGKRVFESTSRFIEKRLRLKVNRLKSAVARPEQRHFLGFSLESVLEQDKVAVHLSRKSREKIDDKLRELTPRNWGKSLDDCIKGINTYLNGWIEYFKICTTEIERVLQTLDAHIRRRLRAIQLRHWKRKRTIVRNLIRLGANPKAAWRGIYAGNKSLWVLSHIPVVDRTLRNAKFARRGLMSLRERWQALRPKPSAQMPLVFG